MLFSDAADLETFDSTFKITLFSLIRAHTLVNFAGHFEITQIRMGSLTTVDETRRKSLLSSAKKRIYIIWMDDRKVPRFFVTFAKGATKVPSDVVRATTFVRGHKIRVALRHARRLAQKDF